MGVTKKAARRKKSDGSGVVSKRVAAHSSGPLLIIGGAEEKEGDRLILRSLARLVGDGPLVVATVASRLPEALWADYERIFRDLGVRHVRHLQVETREEARDEKKCRQLEDARAVFFTGGDQLKITSILGDTPIYAKLVELHSQGGLIAGTSAGASVVCETMMVSGEGSSSEEIRGSLRLAPGFGLLPGTIIDQHFAERGRIGRLISAVARNPRILGIGIDEDTAILVENGRKVTVVGSGAVYIVDGEPQSYTNLTEESPDRTLSVFGLRLHVLSMGDEFDLSTRVPRNRPAEEIEEALLGD